MSRRRFIASGLFLALSASAGSAFSAAPFIKTSKKRPFNAQAVLAQDESGNALVEEGADTPRPIASVTKLMTALVALDDALPGKEIIKITSTDVDTLKFSSSHLPVGSRITREQALVLALMASENRAAAALARCRPGGTAAFVEAMNAKADALGMRWTRFADPSGLNPHNQSTAFDLARLVAAAAANPVIRSATSTKWLSLKLAGEQIQFHNTNALIYSPSWSIDAAKTGFINEAGYCLALKQADGHGTIVVLGAESKESRIADATKLKRAIAR